jgi:serine/threonine-protein kinase
LEDRTVFQPSPFGSVRPGVRLNGIYEIVTFVTQGGMGEVYRGFNIQTGDPVAIKMIRPELTNNSDVLELFKREAKTLHQLAHEAIVRYFVFTVDPDTRRAYLAMEFVDGLSLTNRFESSPLPLADVKILQRRIGSALEAAHRLGVIHRDISPDNIILPEGDVRYAKVIDFGIARSLKRTEATIIGGGFAGKYNYASPEQFGLSGGEVTFKSDIYSFGLVLAAALRGRPIDMSGSEVEAIAKRRAVPDLSDTDQAIRPLIRAMLQPLPADRPASMAAVAVWPPGEATSIAARREDMPQMAGGRAAAILGALIALGSVGGATYVFRDELAHWAQALMAPTTPPGPVKPSPPMPPTAQIPPLTPPPEGAAPAVTQEASRVEPASTPQPSAEPTEVQPAPNAGSSSQALSATAPHIPKADELVDGLPPRAPQPVVDLPPATVGAPYHAELPAFADPGGKGLRLTSNGLPEGLAFNDLGAGSGAIEGAPTHAGSAAVQIVATNHNGKSGQMSAWIDIINPAEKPQAATTPDRPTQVAPAPPQSAPPASPPQAPPPAPLGATARLEPPRPSLPVATLEGATVGSDFMSDLPPFSAGANTAGLTLRADAPAGLNFADLGSGSSRISGKPAAPGSYSFDVVATDASGQSTKMAVKLLVAPPPTAAKSERPQPSPAAPVQKSELTPQHPAPPLTPIEKAKAFVAAFDGGDCFLVKPRATAHSYQVFGREPEPFQRFDSTYKTEVGVEADLRAALITAEECPALDLIRLGTASDSAPPRVELANYSVGRGKPLAGTITNLAGRRPYLILVDNDGVASRLDVKMQPGGDGATFNVPLTPDRGSVGPMQVLLVVVSPKPIPVLETLRQARLASISARLMDEARVGSASIEADYFKFTN